MRGPIAGPPAVSPSQCLFGGCHRSGKCRPRLRAQCRSVRRSRRLRARSPRTLLAAVLRRSARTLRNPAPIALAILQPDGLLARHAFEESFSAAAGHGVFHQLPTVDLSGLLGWIARWRASFRSVCCRGRRTGNDRRSLARIFGRIFHRRSRASRLACVLRRRCLVRIGTGARHALGIGCRGFGLRVRRDCRRRLCRRGVLSGRLRHGRGVLGRFGNRGESGHG